MFHFYVSLPECIFGVYYISTHYLKCIFLAVGQTKKNMASWLKTPVKITGVSYFTLKESDNEILEN